MYIIYHFHQYLLYLKQEPIRYILIGYSLTIIDGVLSLFKFIQLRNI